MCATRRKRTGSFDDIVNIPRSGPFLGVLVTVDFLLVESPLGKRLLVRPQGDLGRNMHEPKVTSLALPCLSVVCLKDIKVE